MRIGVFFQGEDHNDLDKWAEINFFQERMRSRPVARQGTERGEMTAREVKIFSGVARCVKKVLNQRQLEIFYGAKIFRGDFAVPALSPHFMRRYFALKRITISRTGNVSLY